ncbi:MAG: Fur family transcriptional regulator, partial [Planctomycetota bacterium]
MTARIVRRRQVGSAAAAQARVGHALQARAGHAPHGATPAALKAHRLRPTRARLEVYRLLIETRAPLTHAEVSERMKKGRDRVTVYRALDALVAHGLVHTVSFPDRKRRFAACVEHPPHQEEHSDGHAHFICSRCAATLCVGQKKTLLNAVQRWL